MGMVWPHHFLYIKVVRFNNTKQQVLIKSQQNWLKQEVEQFAVRSVY